MPTIYKENDIARSNIFTELSVDLKELFHDLELDEKYISKFRGKVIKLKDYK